MKTILLTPRARLDLEEIWDYLFRDNPSAAERVLNSVERVFAMLAANPEAGHVRGDLAPEAYGFFPVYSYLVVYRAEAAL